MEEGAIEAAPETSSVQSCLQYLDLYAIKYGIVATVTELRLELRASYSKQLNQRSGGVRDNFIGARWVVIRVPCGGSVPSIRQAVSGSAGLHESEPSRLPCHQRKFQFV